MPFPKDRQEQVSRDLCYMEFKHELYSLPQENAYS